ncbi:hypothetical protein [Pineapple vitivirus A]|uniref:Uncharacterized protein n=1 Tax=Pineapple vitivirus A TaxID=2967992 RepID=A0AAE9SME3_9VIRU|nr:hypothetical protein [Pineapple vitivirus A]
MYNTFFYNKQNKLFFELWTKTGRNLPLRDFILETTKGELFQFGSNPEYKQATVFDWLIITTFLEYGDVGLLKTLIENADNKPGINCEGFTWKDYPTPGVSFRGLSKNFRRLPPEGTLYNAAKQRINRSGLSTRGEDFLSFEGHFIGERGARCLKTFQVV